MKLSLRTWLILLAVIVAAVIIYFTQANKTPTAKTIAITQIVEHPALDAARKGIIDLLNENGYTEGENLTVIYESAQGNPTISKQIADKFIADNPDVVVGISTPSAQTLATATQTIPVVFSAVTDPVAAGLVANFNQPEANVTGVSDLSPIKKHVELIVKMLPNIKSLGVIYNSGESNSVVLVDLLDEASGGINIVKSVVTKSSEVQQATQNLVGKVDAIYIPTDNTVVSALESVLKVAVENRIPVFAGDEESVARGAVATLSFDYYDVGVQTGEIVLEILNNTPISEIPSRYVEETSLVINTSAASKLGMNIDQDIIDSADKVIE